MAEKGVEEQVLAMERLPDSCWKSWLHNNRQWTGPI